MKITLDKIQDGEFFVYDGELYEALRTDGVERVVYNHTKHLGYRLPRYIQIRAGMSRANGIYLTAY